MGESGAKVLGRPLYSYPEVNFIVAGIRVLGDVANERYSPPVIVTRWSIRSPHPTNCTMGGIECIGQMDGSRRQEVSSGHSLADRNSARSQAARALLHPGYSIGTVPKWRPCTTLQPSIT